MMKARQTAHPGVSGGRTEALRPENAGPRYAVESLDLHMQPSAPRSRNWEERGRRDLTRPAETCICAATGAWSSALAQWVAR